jgi:hypothetical protein
MRTQFNIDSQLNFHLLRNIWTLEEFLSSNETLEEFLSSNETPYL